MNISVLTSTMTSIVEVLLNSLWQGIMLVALTYCLLRLMRRTNAATRYTIWFLTLLILSLAPFYGSLSSRIGSALTPIRQASADVTQTHDSFNRADSAESAGTLNVNKKAAPTIENSEQNYVRGALEERVGTLTNASESSTVTNPAVLTISAGWWAALLLFVWLLVAGVRLYKIYRSWLHLRHLKRSCVPGPSRNQSILKEILATRKVGRKVSLCSSSMVSMPMVVGFVNPTIMFPAALMGMLTDEEFEQVLLHELAHVRRRDDWSNMGQKLIEAIFFFHPAVLWIGRQLNMEREIACDDWVITGTKEGNRYALCLTKLIEFTLSSRRTSLAPHAATGGRQIAHRIELLLQAKRNASPYPSKRRLLAALLLAVFTIVQFQRVIPGIALIEPMTAAAAPTLQNAMSGGATSAQGEPESHQRLENGLESSTTQVNKAQNGRLRGHVLSPSTTAELERERNTVALNGRESIRGDATISFEPVQSQKAPVGEQSAEDSAEEMVRAAGNAASDFDKARFLIGAVQRFPLDKVLTREFFETTRTLRSSWDKGQVLSAVVKRRPHNHKLFLKILSLGTEIESDEDKTDFLMLVAEVCPDDEAVFSAFVRSVATIGSALDKERALSALLKRGSLSKKVLTEALDLAMNDMGSNRSSRKIMDMMIGRLSE